MKMNCKITMPDASRLKERLKPVQRYIDSEILRKAEPYVPMDKKFLKRSGTEGTKIGSGIIRYIAPYARKRYYIAKNNGRRGPYWMKRAMANHKQEIVRGAQKLLDKGVNK
ncbi:MAG: hypothetical protein ACI4JN_10040 [Ruminococcus sp.]